MKGPLFVSLTALRHISGITKDDERLAYASKIQVNKSKINKCFAGFSLFTIKMDKHFIPHIL